MPKKAVKKWCFYRLFLMKILNCLKNCGKIIVMGKIFKITRLVKEFKIYGQEHARNGLEQLEHFRRKH